MHPILSQRRRLLLYLTLFSQVGLLLAELIARLAGAPRLHALLLIFPVVVLHAFGCLASWYLCRSLPLEGGLAGGAILAHLVAGLLASSLLVVAGGAWARGLDGIGDFSGSSRVWEASIGLVFVSGLLLFSLATAVHYLLMALEASQGAERRAYELEILAREAELRALKAQLDPHFLFNSLNSISALVTTEPGLARSMCERLAEFLRLSLRWGAELSISLEQELRLVETYLEIEAQRFGHRLRFEAVVDEGCAQSQVPPLLLQPLVENAVRHGIAHLLEGGLIRVEAASRGAELALVVRNPCDPDRPPGAGEGIGLRNVRQRLRTRFGRDADLRTVDEGDCYRVELRLPRRRPSAADRHRSATERTMERTA